MTKEEIVEMARQCGYNLETFAKLVAEREREECAKLMDEMAVKDKVTNFYKVSANAIRARAQKK